MINIKSVQKLINENKKKVAPKVFFAWDMTEEELKEVEEREKDDPSSIIMIYDTDNRKEW